MSTAVSPVLFKKEPEFPIEQLLTMLDSPDAAERTHSLGVLGHRVRTEELPVTRRLLHAILDRPLAFSAGHEIHVWRDTVKQVCHSAVDELEAIKRENEAVLARLENTIATRAGNLPTGTSVLPKGSLAESLFKEFHRPAWVVQLLDTGLPEARAAGLAMHLLGKAEFRSLRPKEFLPGGFSFTLPEAEGVKALLLLGDPADYFSDPADTANWDVKGARYSLCSQDESQHDLRSADWCHPYHCCILENVGAKLAPLRHRAHLDSNVLTDYALVQKYAVSANGQRVVVVRIVGCTRVGTYAATHWASCGLPDGFEPGGPIPAPPRASKRHKKSRWMMEALIKVTARAPTHCASLPEIQIELLDLRVPGLTWHEEDFEWKAPTPHRIELMHAKHERPAATSVTAVFLDGELSRTRPGTEAFRLLVALCVLKQQLGRIPIPIRALGEDKTIWTERGQRSDATVMARLRLLNKRHLGQAVRFGRDKKNNYVCFLNAEVQFIEEGI